jgi:hypothetical protein
MDYEMNDLQGRRRSRLSNPYAQRIASVGRETNNPGLGKQQGTTITIYDTIALDGSPNVCNFFENLNNKGFPFTNLTRNSFTDAEAMVIQRIYLSLLTIDNGTAYALSSSNVINVYELDSMSTVSPQYQKFGLSQASILVSGQEVLKNFSFQSMLASFNYKSQFKNIQNNGEESFLCGHNVYTFATAPSIPPNREFKVPLTLPVYTEASASGSTHYLRLTLEGFGAIPSVAGTL